MVTSESWSADAADGTSGVVRENVPKRFFMVNMRVGTDGSAGDERVARTCDDIIVVGGFV